MPKIELKWPAKRKTTPEQFEKHVESLKRFKMCINCSVCVPVGEGDYLCEAADPSCLVLIEFKPTGEYLWCDGKEWRRV